MDSLELHVIPRLWATLLSIVIWTAVYLFAGGLSSGDDCFREGAVLAMGWPWITIFVENPDTRIWGTVGYLAIWIGIFYWI